MTSGDPGSSRLRLVFFGSGAFGLPTLRKLADQHDVALVVTQPDRPAGRHRAITPTPIAQFALERGLAIVKPQSLGESGAIESIVAAGDGKADAFVVIAYGNKLPEALIGTTFAINLHGSLLPKFRGAAPINWAMIHGERETGLSVITLADRMDAGLILAFQTTPISESETAGELHDRLATMGPGLVLEVLDKHVRGELKGIEQDERKATQAPRLARSDGTVRFDQPAIAVRNRIHGLTPWPGCAIRLDGRPLNLLRAMVALPAEQPQPAGEVLADRTIACSPGRLQLLEVQPPGGRVMTFVEYCNGHPVRAGSKCEPL